MEEKIKNRPGLDANMLRLLAMALMLCDHLWATLLPAQNWMTHLGRIAFPIFAFQIAQGYVHTSNFRKYALRLLCFAIVSEIPFNLFYAGSVFFPFHQNVLWTLLLGLLCIRQADTILHTPGRKKKLLAVLFLLLLLLVSVFAMTDYGWRGVLTVLGFYVAGLLPLTPLWQGVLLVLLNMVRFQGWQLEFELFGKTFALPEQSFAVLALIPICLYNGKRGVKNKIMQYGFYIFYPLHMLVLWLVLFLG